MKVGFPLLAGLARSCGLVLPQAGDSELTIPPTILPTCQIPLTWSSVPQPVGRNITIGLQENSGFVAYSDALAPATGPFTTRLIRLGPGVWNVWWSYFLLFPATANTFEIQAQMQTPSGSGGNSWMLARLITDGGQKQSWEKNNFWVAVPNGHAFSIDVLLNNTAGGATYSFDWSAIANKYLG